MRSNYSTGFDGLTAVALVLILVMGGNILSDRGSSTAEAAVHKPPLQTAPPDLQRVIPPYTDYVLTQGPHGQSYGHLAIDLTAGKGAAIQSPIDGEVTAHYVDDLGNTTLVIENSYYQVTLLHGIYVVQVGEHLSQGQLLGTESNQGFTVDAWGNLCSGRDCGYHTHLNIFDKTRGENVNPLEIMAEE
jgi:murein DD-endopeptidase MepM/ murein hydrolase activator NlpD